MGNRSSGADGLWRRFNRSLRYHVLGSIRRRLTRTDRLLHLMTVFVVPLLLGTLTWLSNAVRVLPFVIYPPLAAGTYTLFADPDSRYAEPLRFVGGMTLGALSGWASLRVLSALWYTVPPGQMEVHAGATALAVGTTALVTWGLDLEVPTAFSAALLALLAGPAISYVLAIGLSSAVVAGLFAVWRTRVYDHRDQFLFHSATADDRVLIPIRGLAGEGDVALFGATIAAAHEAGRVILYRATQQELPDPTLTPADEPANGTATPDVETLGPASETTAIGTLGRIQNAIEETVDVPVEVAIRDGDPEDPGATVDAAHTLDCDLIVAGHPERLSEPSPYLSGLFGSDLDAIALQTAGRRSSWSRVLVLVRGPGRTARAMLDFAVRLAATPERVSVAHTIESTERRREAETMLAELVDTVDADVETRVAQGPVEAFLERNGAYYDVVFVGSSTDRSVASRILSPPTVTDLGQIDADLALVHLGSR
jgi:hypothetical protein